MAFSGSLARVASDAVDPPVRRSRRDFLTARIQPEPAGYWLRVHRRAMACRFEITLAAEHAAWLPAARAGLDEIDRLEDALSVFREGSLISRINRGAHREPVEVDAATIALLRRCEVLHQHTGGAFDITSTPLSRCWGFLHREGRLPAAEEIAAARGSVGADAVRIDEARRTVRFDRPGIELNLGAIGKGYALDRVGRGLRQAGAGHALLSAGRSSLLALGPSTSLRAGPSASLRASPSTSLRAGDEGWHVEIVSPTRPGALAHVWLRNAALGTSGAGEQFVVIDGVRYGHVIDPRTGWPAAGVVSASAIASSAAEADALSTAFLIGGTALAERYCAEHPDVMALITEEGAASPVVIGNHARVRVERERLRCLT